MEVERYKFDRKKQIPDEDILWSPYGGFNYQFYYVFYEPPPEPPPGTVTIHDGVKDAEELASMMIEHTTEMDWEEMPEPFQRELIEYCRAFNMWRKEQHVRTTETS